MFQPTDRQAQRWLALMHCGQGSITMMECQSLEARA
jgi:hypothetical protein